jgi:hypothetical protein
MKTTPLANGARGYVSYAMVLSIGMILVLLMAYAYKSASRTQAIQASVQLRNDYLSKEDAVLRSIIAIAPNRAMRAMQSGSSASTSVSQPLRWDNIFSDALNQANARTSIATNVRTSLNLTSPVVANAGDSGLANINTMFRGIGSETSVLASTGLNRSLGTGFPPALSSVDSTVNTNDRIYPIISNSKVYGSLASSQVGLPVATYPNFNLITYPNINFGYLRPGDSLVAKRNWWAFNLDLAANDTAITGASLFKRDFVFSIYEIPSQLAISASSFLSFGQYTSGSAWQNVTIEGGVFAGRASVEGSTALSNLASRRGSTLSSSAVIGGQTFANSPTTAGVREQYEVTTGQFFPVSMPSESGRAAFISINRGPDYFDRFAHAAETNTLSTTTWNNYSVGALQAAMRLDITGAVSSTNPSPTVLRFQYFRGGTRQTLTIPLTTGPVSGLAQGFIRCCDENQSYTFSSPVDVAYGAPGGWAYQNNVSGTVTFNNARFGDPLVGTFKAGYFRTSYPFEIKTLASGQFCVAVYPKRFASFMALLNADALSVNHSLVVNVDYPSNVLLRKPSIPCTQLDYGLILEECDDMRSFTRGFSLVTNLRLFIGDDFNTVATTPPSGFTPPSGTSFFPPCSLFAPEERYGVNSDPFAVQLSGQVGSLASETDTNPTRPLDSTGVSGGALSADRITVNLRPIRHPAELPPITMMNWLVVLEERRKEFY